MDTVGPGRRRSPAPDLEGRRALAIVPAYNEGQAIARTIRDLKRRAPWTDVLVVNDGSYDDTGQCARAAGAKVIDLPVNLGIGGAVQTGYRYAHREGYDLAFQFDGDGQHRASQLTEIATPILRGEADLVVGSRFLAGRGMGATGLRLLGIKIISVAVSIILRQRVTDPTSGFRAAGRRVLALFAREYPQDYPEPESLVLVHKHGLKVREVATTMRRRRAGKSSIATLHGAHYMTKALLAIVMETVKRPVRYQREDA